MSHEIVQPVKCKLCGKDFVPPAALIIDPRVRGKNGVRNSRIETFIVGLMHHMVEQHVNESHAIMLQVTQYQGLLMLQNYLIPDPQVAEQRDRLRWDTHQATLFARFTDEKLNGFTEELSAQIIDVVYKRIGNTFSAELQGAKLEVRKLLAEVLVEIRDLLEEPGKYSDELVKPA